MPHADLNVRRAYQRNYQQAWRARNCKKWAGILKRAFDKRKHLPAVKKRLREVRYRRHHRNKVKVLEMYGTSCAYCGCDKYEALCVDHKNDDGSTHRKTLDYLSVNNGGMFGYCANRPFRPDLYQILCQNCNAIKDRYGIYPGGEVSRPLSWWKAMSQLRTLK
jgi:hypothetical protein